MHTACRKNTLQTLRLLTAAWDLGFLMLVTWVH
jgi:hypothetical protein